jgi:hypothetical protein
LREACDHRGSWFLLQVSQVVAVVARTVVEGCADAVCVSKPHLTAS